MFSRGPCSGCLEEATCPHPNELTTRLHLACHTMEAQLAVWQPHSLSPICTLLPQPTNAQGGPAALQCHGTPSADGARGACVCGCAVCVLCWLRRGRSHVFYRLYVAVCPPFYCQTPDNPPAYSFVSPLSFSIFSILTSYLQYSWCSVVLPNTQRTLSNPALGEYTICYSVHHYGS